MMIHPTMIIAMNDFLVLLLHYFDHNDVLPVKFFDDDCDERFFGVIVALF